MYFILDFLEVISVLSQQFQKEGIFVTDIVNKLKTAILKLEELKVVAGKNRRNFKKTFDCTSKVLKCGKECSQEVTLKGVGEMEKSFCNLLNKCIGYIEHRFATL